MCNNFDRNQVYKLSVFAYEITELFLADNKVFEDSSPRRRGALCFGAARANSVPRFRAQVEQL